MFNESGGVTHTQNREYARKACEGALQRLGMDYVDLFTLRGPVQPDTDIADLMMELKVGSSQQRTPVLLLILGTPACDRHSWLPRVPFLSTQRQTALHWCSPFPHGQVWDVFAAVLALNTCRPTPACQQPTSTAPLARALKGCCMQACPLHTVMDQGEFVNKVAFFPSSAVQKMVSKAVLYSFPAAGTGGGG